MNSYDIYIGDSRSMKELKNNSIQLIVTSPPYWQLKDYGAANQIGFNDSYEDYINNLNLVWQECERVLEPGCRLVVNIGDQFARSVYYGRYKIIPIRTEIIRFCETVGMDYMGSIIWQKKTTMNTSGGATIMGSYPYPRNGIIEIDYEFIMIFKKPGKTQKIDKDIKKESAMTKEEWKEYFSGHWNFGGVKQDKHLAMFPEELPKRVIKMFSFVGDTVLDPFLGSGTTMLAAKNLQRSCTGYEINEDFLQIIKKKVGYDDFRLFENNSFRTEVCEQRTMSFDGLPYTFIDPLKLDSKIDQRKITFGSKINKETSSTTNFFTVTKIINPTQIEVDNSVKVQLIGIEPVNHKVNEALDFLTKKIFGNKVYFRYDEKKYNNNDELMCYVYLKNKTFINAHLLKNNLVKVDVNQDFRLKDKFLRIGGNNG